MRFSNMKLTAGNLTPLVVSASIHESGGRFHVYVETINGTAQTSTDTLAKAKGWFGSEYGGTRKKRTKWTKQV